MFGLIFVMDPLSLFLVTLCGYAGQTLHLVVDILLCGWQEMCVVGEGLEVTDTQCGKQKKCKSQLNVNGLIKAGNHGFKKVRETRIYFGGTSREILKT